MAIVTNLEEVMKEKGYTLVELAKEVGISTVNLSKIKNGNISAIRFSTLDEICKVLECEPGDILKYKEINKKKVIPLFLDYSGTTDLLLKGGAENVKKFFDSIIAMQSKSNYEIQITMITGSSFESAKSKYKLLNVLAENYGLPNLFDGVVAEYCGFIIRKDKSRRLLTLDTRILDKRAEIEDIAEQYGGKISPEVTSIYNISFHEITRTHLAEISEQIEKIIDCPDIETVTYYDAYGKECDVKPKKHSKSEVVYMLTKKLKEKYDIPFVIIGGDSQDEDLKMYTINKQRMKEKVGLKTVFIAPANIGEIANNDKDIIIGNWANSDGIAQCIETLSKRIKVREDGGIEL